jgi:hypothetical protein
MKKKEGTSISNKKKYFKYIVISVIIVVLLFSIYNGQKDILNKSDNNVTILINDTAKGVNYSSGVSLNTGLNTTKTNSTPLNKPINSDSSSAQTTNNPENFPANNQTNQTQSNQTINQTEEELPQFKAVDSDSSTYTTKGTCDDGNIVIKQDACENQYNLVEWVVENNSCVSKKINCQNTFAVPKVCDSGMCVSKAVDNDAYDNEFKQSNCIDYKGSHEDICTPRTNNEYVTEWYIDADSPGICSSKDKACKDGCDNGACVDIGDSKCEVACRSVSRDKYNYGFCLSYNSGGAASQSSTCSAKGAVYESISGCTRGYICCCDTAELV